MEEVIIIFEIVCESREEAPFFFNFLRVSVLEK